MLEANNIEQRSDEWFAQRLAKVTASRIADIMAKTKSGYSASREAYMNDLLTERLTGKPAKSFTNAAMQHGIDTEPQARTTYELFTGNQVTQTGFHIHPTIAMAGASPDGLVGDDGLLEIKCPQPPAHSQLLDKRKIPHRYMLQMQWQMACTGAKWCDFVSFNPDFPAPFDMFIKRLERDDDLISLMEREVLTFLAELEAKLTRLQKETSRGGENHRFEQGKEQAQEAVSGSPRTGEGKRNV